jgi:hypothetical protein
MVNIVPMSKKNIVMFLSVAVFTLILPRIIFMFKTWEIKSLLRELAVNPAEFQGKVVKIEGFVVTKNDENFYLIQDHFNSKGIFLSDNIPVSKREQNFNKKIGDFLNHKVIVSGQLKASKGYYVIFDKGNLIASRRSYMVNVSKIIQLDKSFPSEIDLCCRNAWKFKKYLVTSLKSGKYDELFYTMKIRFDTDQSSPKTKINVQGIAFSEIAESAFKCPLVGDYVSDAMFVRLIDSNEVQIYKSGRLMELNEKNLEIFCPNHGLVGLPNFSEWQPREGAISNI